MRLAERMREATFISRQNRFACLVELSGHQETVYLANSGRLDSVLLPGHTVFLADRSSPSRRTQYDLVATDLNGTLVSVDSRVPGELVYKALLDGNMSPFERYSSVRREVPRGSSRLDFLLSNNHIQCFVEVKSVTLVRQGKALFPDSPTLRGRRHLHTLIWARKDGYGAAIVFIVQREDVECFSPNDAVDAAFGHDLRAAQVHGVDIYAYRCRVTQGEIDLAGQIPIRL
ncbi:DNA/RNA nuclease SfsA [Chloroflexota bacterium]